MLVELPDSFKASDLKQLAKSNGFETVVLRDNRIRVYKPKDNAIESHAPRREPKWNLYKRFIKPSKRELTPC